MPVLPENPKAFPRALAEHEAGDTPVEGMDLRDYFAAHALPVIASNIESFGTPLDDLADQAYSLAEKMLRRRERHG